MLAGLELRVDAGPRGGETAAEDPPPPPRPLECLERREAAGLPTLFDWLGAPVRGLSFAAAAASRGSVQYQAPSRRRRGAPLDLTYILCGGIFHRTHGGRGTTTRVSDESRTNSGLRTYLRRVRLTPGPAERDTASPVGPTHDAAGPVQLGGPLSTPLKERRAPHMLFGIMVIVRTFPKLSKVITVELSIFEPFGIVSALSYVTVFASVSEVW